MGITATGRIEVTWPQDQAVPLRGSYEVCRDDRDGAIDYDHPVNDAAIPAWPDGEGKRGFGLAAFGTGPFGIGDGGAGFGQGLFGLGAFGFGAAAMRHATDELGEGAYTLAVVPRDAAGNVTTPATATALAAVAPAPAAPTNARATEYEDDELTIQFDLSGDDDNA